MGIAFRSEEFKPIKKEFRGVIVGAEYSEEPFGIKGDPEIAKRMAERGVGKKLGIKIQSEEYEKYQYEWFFPSSKAGTRWHWFIEALERTGAIREVSIAGNTDEERMQSFCKSLVGMEFHWEEQVRKAMGGRETDVLLPTVYYGKKKVEGEIREVKVE